MLYVIPKTSSLDTPKGNFLCPRDTRCSDRVASFIEEILNRQLVLHMLPD